MIDCAFSTCHNFRLSLFVHSNLNYTNIMYIFGSVYFCLCVRICRSFDYWAWCMWFFVHEFIYMVLGDYSVPNRVRQRELLLIFIWQLNRSSYIGLYIYIYERQCCCHRMEFVCSRQKIRWYMNLQVPIDSDLYTICGCHHSNSPCRECGTAGNSHTPHINSYKFCCGGRGDSF